MLSRAYVYIYKISICYIQSVFSKPLDFLKENAITNTD